LNAGGHFLRGLVQLGSDPHAAIASLRRALLIDPRFGLASFQLGRAYEAAGDPAAALAAYDQALFTLDPDDMRYAELLRQVDLGDVATAIRARIQVLR
jgi:tetratricopeptide (TPR) repeat protein